MRTVVLASVRLYARRYVATALAVVIGVAFVVVVNALSSATRSGLLADAAAEYHGAGVVVTDVSDGRRADRVAAALPGEATVAYRVFGSVSADGRTLDDAASAGTVSDDSALRWQRLARGAFPSGPGEAVADEHAASTSGIHVGDRLRVGVGRTARTVRVTGLVDSSAGVLGSQLYLSTATMQAYGDQASVDAVVTTSSDVAAARDVLPKGAHADRTDDYLQGQQAALTRGVDVISILLLVFAAIAFFVSALVIANTFTILLAQRVRDFALLRCVGASARQIRRSVLAEALVVGLTSATAGVLTGVVLGQLLTAAARSLVTSFPLGAVHLSATWLVGAWLLGVLLTVLASLVPTRRGTQVSPLAALQPAGRPDLRTRAGLLRLLAGGVLIAGGGGLLALAVAGQQVPLMLGGGMVSFVGVLLLAPLVIPASVRLLGVLVNRTGVPGRLAVGNALSNPRRTASTAASLLVGVTLVSGLVVGMATIRASVEGEVASSYPLDASLTSDRPLAADTLPSVRGVDGVAAAAVLPGVDATVRGRGADLGSLPLLGVDGSTAAAVHGSPAFLHPSRGTVYLPWTQLGGLDGTRVQVRVDGRSTTLVARGADGVHDVGLVSAATLRGLSGGDAPARAAWVRATAGADAADLQSTLAGVADSTHTQLAGALGERAFVDQQLRVMTWAVLALLGVGVLIALIGIGNTLGLSVLERTRESAVLRALGLTRSQLRATLAVEALLLATVAGVLGVAIGVVYAWLGSRTVLGAALDTVTLTVPWAQLVVIVLVSALAGLAACVLPARRAAQIAPAAGLTAD